MILARELKERLDGYPDEVVDGVIEHLRAKSLIEDEATPSFQYDVYVRDQWQYFVPVGHTMSNRALDMWAAANVVLDMKHARILKNRYGARSAI